MFTIFIYVYCLSIYIIYCKIYENSYIYSFNFYLENADILFEIPLEVVMIYTLVCTCGTILFCSASYFLPLCRKGTVQ